MDFDLVYDTAGGASLDASFAAVRRFGHVVSCLGWGTHTLGPLSFRAATYSGVFTLLPLLTGEGRKHHGDILAEATRLAEAGQLVPTLDPRRFTLATVTTECECFSETERLAFIDESSGLLNARTIMRKLAVRCAEWIRIPGVTSACLSSSWIALAT